jgi:hypothetical protein
MDQKTSGLFFGLLRSAVSGEKLEDEILKGYCEELFEPLYKLSSEHDISHLFLLGLKQNGLINENDPRLDKVIFKAVFRYEKLKYDYDNVCQALEEAKIPFIPLKGAIMREYYPEPWMRTSCDIDILVKNEDLDKAIDCLCKNLGFEKRGRSTHDVGLISPAQTGVELHFDLVEEDCANNAIETLNMVWDVSIPEENCLYRHRTKDEFFYFYHIAHMAKHFENGGCGIRPFIDLWILDRSEDKSKPNEFLLKSDLQKFADAALNLSRVWFEAKEADELSLQMQDFLLKGGIYGTTTNRVAVSQNKKGGRLSYLVSRIFAPKEKLQRYYPILEKHPILLPVMQVRRWFMLLNPKIAKMAKSELSANKTLDGEKAKEMKNFLNEVGLK